MEKNKIPFPQADDMRKIFKIISVANQDDLKNKSAMQIILGDITSRQVQYYLNATEFLGIIDSNKKFTIRGNELRQMNYYEQVIKISQIIISNEIFGEVYFSQVISGTILTREEIIPIMKKYVKFNSEEMYKRRSQTIFKWIEWINNNDERFKK